MGTDTHPLTAQLTRLRRDYEIESRSVEREERPVTSSRLDVWWVDWFWAWHDIGEQFAHDNGVASVSPTWLVCR